MFKAIKYSLWFWMIAAYVVGYLFYHELSSAAAIFWVALIWVVYTVLLLVGKFENEY